MEEPSIKDTYELQRATLDGEQHPDVLVCNTIRSPTESCTSFQFGHSLSEDDDEHTESKIRAFLEEKVLFSMLISHRGGDSVN